MAVDQVSDVGPGASSSSSSSASAFHHVQSPRVVQGCVTAFLQLFEWYPGKRISSSNRLPPDKLHILRRRSLSAARGLKESCTDSLRAKLLLNEDEEEDDRRLWYTGARSNKWSGKQIARSTSLSVDEPNKRVPGGVVARLMGLESLPDQKAPILHLGNPHTDLLHGNLCTTKQSVTEDLLQDTVNQGPKLLELEEEEEEAFGNSFTTKAATIKTHHQAGGKKQPSLFELHYAGIQKNRKGLFLTPESCLEADLDAKLLGPVLEPISGSFWGPVLEPKCAKSSEKNQTSQGSRDSERIRSESHNVFLGTHEEKKVRRRSSSSSSSTGYGSDLASNLKSSASESCLWEESTSSSQSATDHGSNLQQQKTHQLFPNFELPQRSQSLYQVDRTLQINHSGVVDEQYKHNSYHPQRVKDIFSQVSNLQNEKFANMKKNEARFKEMDQKLESQAKVDMKWEAPECKSGLELDNRSRGIKLNVKDYSMNGRRASQQPSGEYNRTTQQFDYRSSGKEEKETLDQEKSMLLSETCVGLDGSESPQSSSSGDAAAKTNKAIHGGRLKSHKHWGNKKHRVEREQNDEGDTQMSQLLPPVRRSILQDTSCKSVEAASESTIDKPRFVSSSAKQNQSEICRPDGWTVNMINTKSCLDLELLLPGDTFAQNLTDTAEGFSELMTATNSVARELFPNRSKPKFAQGKKCPSHTKPRSINEVFPELPMEEMTLKLRSNKDDNCMRASKNSPSTPRPQTPNNWIHETTVFTDYAASGCSPANSPILHLQHDKDSSSQAQQDHSSLRQLFMSDSESSSFNLIGSSSRWGSKVSSPSPKDDEEVVLCDLDSNRSSTVCHTCSTSTSPDGDEKLFRMSVDDASWSEDPVTPIFGKKLLDIETKVPSMMRLDTEDNAKVQSAASVEECGQPSPVSILESPFLDESPTTPEESISESEHSLDAILEDGSTGSTAETSLLSSKQALGVDTGGSNATTTDESNRVEQPLVEISNFRNNNNNNVDTLNSSVDDEGQEEEMKTYIREILDATDKKILLSAATNGSSPRWFAPHGVPGVNPSFLSEQLELGSNASLQVHKDIILATDLNQDNNNRTFANNQRLEGSDPRVSWQGDRRLIFDSVNEMMGINSDVQFSSSYYFVPARKLQLMSTGEKLVTEIYGKICESCNFATNAWQSLVDRDLMLHGHTSWFQLHQEIGELSSEIEHMLFKLMIDELIGDLFSDQELESRPPTSSLLVSS